MLARFKTYLNVASEKQQADIQRDSFFKNYYKNSLKHQEKIELNCPSLQFTYICMLHLTILFSEYLSPPQKEEKQAGYRDWKVKVYNPHIWLQQTDLVVGDLK